MTSAIWLPRGYGWVSHLFSPSISVYFSGGCPAYSAIWLPRGYGRVSRLIPLWVGVPSIYSRLWVGVPSIYSRLWVGVPSILCHLFLVGGARLYYSG